MSSSRLTTLDEHRDSAAEVQRKSVHGWMVTLGTQAATVVFQLVSTIVVARLLSPEEHGIVAMVLALSAFAALFRDFGLSSVTIQRDAMSHAQLSTLYWINVATGAILTLTTAASAPLIAWFYQRPEVAGVTFVVSFSFLIGSLGIQQRALLTRHMRFGRIALATLSGSAAGLLVTVILALRGFSYWSLVAGNLCSTAVTTLLLCSLAGWRPGRPAFQSGLRPLLKFGGNITAFEFVNYFHRNLDNMLIGRYWGADALGFYGRAYQLLMLPVQALRTPIFAVAFPALSRLQEQPVEFRAYYRNLVTLLAYLTMPLTSFLFASADSVIAVTLGPRWLGAVDLFLPLAVAGFILPISGSRGIIFLSLGKGSDYFVHGLVKAVIVAAGFLIAVRWGAFGIAVSYAISTYATQVFAIPYTTRRTFVTGADLLRPLLVPAAISFAAGGATIFCASRSSDLDPPRAVLVNLLVFSTLFAVVTMCVPAARTNIWRAARAVIPRGRQGETSS